MIFAIHEIDQIYNSMTVTIFVVIPKKAEFLFVFCTKKNEIKMKNFYQEINLAKFGFKESPASASNMLLRVSPMKSEETT